MEEINFLHSGDMGDIVASLSIVKEICERKNAKANLFLDYSGGKNDKLCSLASGGAGLKFNKKCADFLRPLIEAQPYIANCIPVPDIIKDAKFYNLNAFRYVFYNKDAIKKTNKNLLFAHQFVFKLEIGYKGPWLSVSKKDGHHSAIMFRSLRHHSSDMLYALHQKELENGGCFIGTDLEYQCVGEYFRFKIPRIEVNNALEMAQEIQNSDLFLSNATLAYWIAIGLGHQNIHHEMDLDMPCDIFPNQNPPIKYIVGSHYKSI